MELQELIDSYGQIKKAANKLYTDYKNLMVEAEAQRRMLHAKLEDVGLKSAKSKNFGVSIVSKPTITILNEQSVINWLHDTPDIDYDQYIGIKTTPLKQLALQRLKETGEIIEGTEYAINETVSVKANK